MSTRPEQLHSEEWPLDFISPPQKLTVVHSKGATVMRLLTEGPRPSVSLDSVPSGQVNDPTMLLLGSAAVKYDSLPEDLNEGKLIKGEYVALGRLLLSPKTGQPIPDDKLFVLSDKIESVKFDRATRR